MNDPKNIFEKFNKLLQILCTLKRERLDLLLVFMGIHVYFPLRVVAWFLRKKIVFCAETLLHFERQEMGYGKLRVYYDKILESLIRRTSDSVICVSGNVMNFYRTNKRAFIINHFVDLTEFEYHEDKSILRRKCGLPVEDKLVGVIGPFHVPFNVPYLEYLTKNIDNFDTRIKFLVIGHIPDCFSVKLKNYQTRILNIEKINDQKEYYTYLSALDAVLIPAKIATGGPLTKIIECFAARTPVFTTPKGIVGLEGVINYKNIVVENEQELASAINRIIFDCTKMRSITCYAYELARLHYSRDQAMQQLAANVHKMI
ncbi:glycosyltransferase [Rhodothermus marinus]|uniref:glycosyltransferase n=1 Tax=Rhodothermus marinus TaxID=29549 RepID=UPI0013751FD1|nr:glycosyltransferase [Rhodothermus marinus]